MANILSCLGLHFPDGYEINVFLEKFLAILFAQFLSKLLSNFGHYIFKTILCLSSILFCVCIHVCVCIQVCVKAREQP